jgi:two-component system heavy metal sensor histidine kinase CusS
VLAEHREMRFVYTHQGSGKVMLEPRWLRRVLWNLLANALNASPKGGTVTLNSIIEGDQWRVALDDQGPGVASEYREKIFDRFFRLTPDDDVQEGSGLGLAICRSIISLHGGKIWAEAAPAASGLRMVFVMPARCSEGS